MDGTFIDKDVINLLFIITLHIAKCSEQEEGATWEKCTQIFVFQSTGAAHSDRHTLALNTHIISFHSPEITLITPLSPVPLHLRELTQSNSVFKPH